MYLGAATAEYGFLQGFSTNQKWVNGYQNPFNTNYLFPAAKRGETDPAGAYAMLAPAYQKIRADAIAFVNSFSGSERTEAEATIEGWKKDWPLIEGFLNRWATAAPSAAPIGLPAGAGVDQPTTIFQDQAPAVYGSYGQGGPSQGATTYLPAAPANVNITTSGPGAMDALSTIGEYLPWVAGAAIVGLLMTQSGRR